MESSSTTIDNTPKMTKPTKPSGTVGAAYVRVSDGDKQDHGSQIESIERWAAANGLVIRTWFIDSGSRHKAESRDEFQRMLAAVESGVLDWVVVDAKIRFGIKHSYEFGHFVFRFRKNNVELWSITEGLVSSTDDATVLTNAITDLTSTKEQKERSQRSIRGKVTLGKQGRYQGGYVAFGFDVVCMDKSGAEKWRVVYSGYYDRTKVYPDGRREAYNGKGNMPAHDNDDALYLRPTIEAKRLEAVRWIFETFANEDISLRKLAHRLNEADVDSCYGQGWYMAKVKELLKNPIYVGLPTWNKRGHGAFLEFRGGEYREVEWKGEKPVIGKKRVRKLEEHVQPDKPAFHPIIEPKLFEQVQTKLASIKAPEKRSPRSSELWLSGFLFCAKCMKPMHGWNSAQPYQFKAYVCGTYRTFGPKNRCGCKLHRVNADLCEALVHHYLDETDSKIRAVIEREAESFGMLADLEGDVRQKQAEQIKTTRKMEKLTGFDKATVKVKGQTLRASIFEDVDPLYSTWFARNKGDWERELAAKDAELDRLVDAYADLPAGRAKDKAKAKLAVLEGEIKDLQDRLENLVAKLALIRQETTDRLKALAEAKEAMKADKPRRLAEALRRIVSKIVLHFDHTNAKGKQPKSKLVKFEVFPVSGQVRSFRPEILAGAKLITVRPVGRW